jgi:hypothetical protein
VLFSSLLSFIFLATQAASHIADVRGVEAAPAALSKRVFMPLVIKSKTSAPGPTPTPPPSNVQPVGVPGNWILKFSDEFNSGSLDKTKWQPYWKREGGSINNVATHQSNVSVDTANGYLVLTLASSSSGAIVWSSNIDTRATSHGYSLPVDGYAEARIYFPGNGRTIYNWPAWWAIGYGSNTGSGENDIAEGLGSLTVNYHSPSGTHNQGSVPGVWSDGFHIYGIWRKASSVEVYWDGHLVKSYSTDDSGGAEDLIINVGSDHTAAYGTASQVKVDYVRAWQH